MPKLEGLHKAIETAEKTLEDIKDNKDRKSKRKRKRVNEALDKAYSMLNRKDYTQKEVDDRTDDIWKALMEDEHNLILVIFFFGFLLSGALIFTVFQTYSFIQSNWDPDRTDTLTEDISSLVDVEYTESNIVSLYDQMSVSDAVGLQNPSEDFTISNDSSEVGSLSYIVHYSVNLVPMNDDSAKLIDTKYIKYKYTYKDSKTGKYYESKIGTLDELTTNSDGSLLLTKGTQMKDSQTDFKVIFWISSLATNKEQGSTYTFAFKVNAAIANG
jgi:hypothetical protein